jgi:cytochrome P450
MKRNIVEFTERAWREHGDVFRLVVGPPGLTETIWVISSPDGAAKVLSGGSWTSFAKQDAAYDEVRHWLGENLLTAWGDEWTRQKRFVQPLFTVRAVEGYAALMADEIEQALAEWEADADGLVDLGDEAGALALRIVVRVLFGDSAVDVLGRIRASLPVLADVTARRALSPARSPHGWPSRLNLRGRAAQTVLHSVVDELVAHRRAGRSHGEHDLLGRLLAASDGDTTLTDQEVRDQVLVFLLAGHETTAIALTFALHLLGRHPETQDALRREVADVVGPGTPTAADARHLVLTTAVLKEAMRLYPSVPFFGRRAVTDEELCGYVVPSGTSVILAPWDIHRDPRLWPDPLRFDPSRFLPESEAREARHRYAWMPFSGGPRACIGQHFSLLEATLALALIVRDRTLEAVTPSDQIRVNNRITLYPVDPVLAVARRR